MKKIISIIITLVMIATIFQIMPSVKAFSGLGSGTAEDPYQITNADELNETNDDLDAYYILMNDIDLDDYGVQGWGGGQGFLPIANGNVFTGSFDGQNHTISNLYINRATQVGLFANTNTYSVVKNIGLINVDITGTDNVGSLIGLNGDGEQSNCYSTGVVTGGASTWMCVGGLIGGISSGSITNCYSFCNVSGSGIVGGFIGRIDGGSIVNCYSTGLVTGGDVYGGLVGQSEVGVTNCYWDNQTSGLETSSAGEGRTTAQMTYPYADYDPPYVGLYEDWDLANYVGDDSIWVHDDLNQNGGYPLFRADHTPLASSLTWTEVVDHTPCGARTISGSTVYNDKMWIMGGTASGNVFNDTWYSTDGRIWTRATENADWIARYGFDCIAYDGKLWIMGGMLWTAPGGEWLDNDVWYTTDGANWTEATADANWTPRSDFTTLVYDGKLWLIGGYDNGLGYLNDVWYTTDGANWTEATATANFTVRSGMTSLVYDEKMWVIGGLTWGPTVLNDTWYSTDGIDWTEATASAGWSARYKHGSVIYNETMWILGGNDGVNSLNDTWYSNDGANWTETSEPAGWYARYDFQCLAYEDEIYIMLGMSESYQVDVWYTGPVLETGDSTTFDAKMVTPQYPNATGWDIGFNSWRQYYTADDWNASENSYVTGIHFWISYYNDNYIDIPSINVSIFSDFPGQPGTLLWNENFTDFNISGPYFGDEGFAIVDWYGEHNHLTFYRIDIENIPEPFVQFNGTIYWLALTIPWFGDPYFPGWKTTTNNSLSPAKIGPADGWFSILDPLTYDPLNLAFVITGEPMTLGDQTQFPDAKMETIQQPDPNGWDMWYNWWYGGYLADDWQCTETGQVTGIHFWVSWYSDSDDEIPWINVSIASDVSNEPNTILWSKEFTTGDFTVTGPYYGDEGFAFSGETYYEHNHQKFWRINIENITQPFLQENGTIYWLMLKLPPELVYVGWKTSLNDTLSGAMFGGIEGWYRISNPTPPYEEFDFSFVITGGGLPPWELHNGWNEYPDNPVYHFNGYRSEKAVVLYDESNFSGNGASSKYKLWADSETGDFYQSLSSDGITWTDETILTNLSAGWHPCILYDQDGFGGTGYYYKIYYWDGTINKLSTRIAESIDGINWENDRLTTQNETVENMQLHTGIDGQQWYLNYGPGCVLYNSSGVNVGIETGDKSDDQPWTWRYVQLFYTSPGETESSGLAYSSDGNYWIRYGDAPVLTPPLTGGWDSDYVLGASILKNNGQFNVTFKYGNGTIIADIPTGLHSGYYCWYTGGNLITDQPDSFYRAGIGLAYSQNGINWTLSSDNPILHYTDGVEWRNVKTWMPCVQKVDDNLTMWFTGSNSTDTSVGLAVYYSDAVPSATNETFVNGTGYASVYGSMLSVNITGYDMGSSSTVFCNLADFHYPYPWISHDTTYYWYVAIDEYESSVWWFHTSKAWDCDENQVVDYIDISIVVLNYLTSGRIPGEIPADIMEDGTVNYLDASSLVSHYGESY